MPQPLAGARAYAKIEKMNSNLSPLHQENDSCIQFPQIPSNKLMLFHEPFITILSTVVCVYVVLGQNSNFLFLQLNSSLPWMQQLLSS